MKKKCRCRYSTVISVPRFEFLLVILNRSCTRFLEVIFALKLHNGQILYHSTCLPLVTIIRKAPQGLESNSERKGEARQTIKHPSAVIKRAHLDVIRQNACWLEMEVGAHLQHPLYTESDGGIDLLCSRLEFSQNEHLIPYSLNQICH